MLDRTFGGTRRMQSRFRNYCASTSLHGQISLMDTGGTPSYAHPNSWPLPQAYSAFAPALQYSFMALMNSQTSVQPATCSFGGTGPPRLILVSNMVVQVASAKSGFAALSCAIFALSAL